MSNRQLSGWIAAFLTGCFLTACGGDEMPIPKPPTYLRSDLPEHTYKRLDVGCPYSFEFSDVYNYNPVFENGQRTCHLDINLGQLNGTMSFSYIEMDRPLKDYIDYALAKVEEHEVKADAIDGDLRIIRPGSRVFGTFFELKGDVASPFQFYLTDSTNRFVSAAVYFNARPNYDSMRPTLEYLKKDLVRMMNTFEWKK
jgi:gliding motility-associated lipoprotein GldD